MPPSAGTPSYNPSPALGTAMDQGTLQSGNAGATDWETVIKTDPNLKGLSPDQVTSYLHGAYGLSSDMKVDGMGKVVPAHSYLARNAWWLLPTALVGGSLVGAYAGGGSGAAGGASAAGAGGSGASATAAVSAAAPSATLGTLTGSAVPGAFGVAAPTATAAGTGGGVGFWSSLGHVLGSKAGQQAIDTGGQIVANQIQAGAGGRAADLQAQAARDALAFEKERYAASQTAYDQWRQQTQAHTLGGLAGAPSAAAPMSPAQPAMITVVAPSGLRAMRPATERDHWIAKGAQVLA